MKHRVHGWLFLVFALLTAGVRADEDIGWVERINQSAGTAAVLHLERNGKKMPVEPFMRLQVGDRFLFEDKSGVTSVDAAFSNGLRRRFAAGQAQVEPIAGKVPSVPVNLLSWLQARLSTPEQRLVMAVSRSATSGRAIRSPLLGNETRFLAGARVMALAWQGGAAPYSVRLSRTASGDADLGTWQLAVPHWRATVDLPAGLVFLSIVDAQGKVLQHAIRVVGESEQPVVPAELAGSIAGSADLLYPAWLAGQADGVWTLLAYSLVAGESAVNESQQRFLDALAQGDRPTL